MSWRSPAHHTASKIMDDGAWKKVKDVIHCGSSTVWSIQVEDDASYTAEGCIVKNCPLQLEIVERGINQFSNKGDSVFDPFNGIGTTAMTAVKMGRYGIGSELNDGYYKDSIGYCEDAENEIDSPTLFDIINLEQEDSQE